MEGHDDPGHVDSQAEDHEDDGQHEAEAEGDDWVPQEHLRVAKKWQGTIAEVCNVSIPEESYAIEDIGGETRENTSVQQIRKEEVLCWEE
jgi:hypothetical protein